MKPQVTKNAKNCEKSPEFLILTIRTPFRTASSQKRFNLWGKFFVHQQTFSRSIICTNNRPSNIYPLVLGTFENRNFDIFELILAIFGIFRTFELEKFKIAPYMLYTNRKVSIFSTRFWIVSM